jgi:hypothetical protein
MSRLLASSALAALLGLSTANAGIIAVDEFSGDMFEGFEGIAPPGSYSPVPLFEGNATMIDSLANIGVIAYVWSGPGGMVGPYNGNLFGGTPAGSTLFGFSTPILRFGGYMTTVSDIADGTIVFRDSEGGVIDSLPVTAAPVTWGWQGWESDVPISSIEVVHNGPFGNRPMQYDDLRITFVPEPAACLLLAAGAALALRRRQ